MECLETMTTRVPEGTLDETVQDARAHEARRARAIGAQVTQVTRQPLLIAGPAPPLRAKGRHPARLRMPDAVRRSKQRGPMSRATKVLGRSTLGNAAPRDGRGLGFMLGVVFRSFADAADEAIEEVPGGRRGYQVLVGAIRDTPDSQAALALQLSVDASAMVHLVDDLEHAGLVQRRIDPADRRRRRLVATARGRRLDASVRAKMQLAEDHVLRCLGSKERETFREMLGRLTSRAAEADAARGTAGAAGTSCTNPDLRRTPLNHPQIRARHSWVEWERAARLLPGGA